MSTITPLGNRVLIKLEKNPTSQKGILLPDSAQEKPVKGVVVAVGEGSRDDSGELLPVDVAVGDRVLFSSYAGTEVKDQGDNEKYLILSEGDILGVLT